MGVRWGKGGGVLGGTKVEGDAYVVIMLARATKDWGEL